MRSHARLSGYSIHQMLIVLPLGLLATAVVFDLIDLATGTGAFSVAAYWMLAAGVIGALVAVPFGLIDWYYIPSGSRAKRIGALHGAGNLLVILLFAASWLLRDEDGMVPVAALALSLSGALVALMSGRLGGELVSRHAVGVHDGADADSPSSLGYDEGKERRARAAQATRAARAL